VPLSDPVPSCPSTGISGMDLRSGSVLHSKFCMSVISCRQPMCSTCTTQVYCCQERALETAAMTWVSAHHCHCGVAQQHHGGSMVAPCFHQESCMVLLGGRLCNSCQAAPWCSLCLVASHCPAGTACISEQYMCGAPVTATWQPGLTDTYIDLFVLEGRLLSFK
jgi:hypothetical protein